MENRPAKFRELKVMSSAPGSGDRALSSGSQPEHRPRNSLVKGGLVIDLLIALIIMFGVVVAALFIGLGLASS